MWKWIKKWREEEEFVKWAKTTSNRLKGDVKIQFDSSWPTVRNNNPEVRGSYVLYWALRSTEGAIHQISQPMSIGYLAYLADGAQATGREDLLPVLNNMIMNIPRLHNEITMEIVKQHSGDEANEEE